MSAPTLESFFLSYVDHVGGVFEPIEPQVYDVMLPAEANRAIGSRAADDETPARVTFDAEALADNADAQLLVFGNPLLDRVFEHAQIGNQMTRVYLGGFNLQPHGLRALIQRSLSLGDGMSLDVVSQRPLHYTSALWQFQATYISDEKVQETYMIGVDLHYGRPARQLEERLARARASEHPEAAFPDATAIPLPRAYALAREEALRGITVSAHVRLAELQRLLTRETNRIHRYFEDSRDELDARGGRVHTPDDAARVHAQRAALDREEQAQIGELKHKMTLSVACKLLNVMLVTQPRLRVRVGLSGPKNQSASIDVSWDVAAQRLDAAVCPTCGRSTFALAFNRAGKLGCPACAGGGNVGKV